MPRFDIRMQHNEDSLVALAHMQYDLFCTRNRMARSLLSAVLIVIGIVYGSSVWSLFLVAYGIFLMTMTYASANRTAHKLCGRLKAANLPFPSSRYVFDDAAMRVISLPDGQELDPLPYEAVLRLGEDRDAYYLFRNQYGGYRVPKTALGEHEEEFRSFVQAKTHLVFHRRLSPLRRLLDWLKKRESEPEHL